MTSQPEKRSSQKTSRKGGPESIRLYLEPVKKKGAKLTKAEIRAMAERLSKQILDGAKDD